MSHPDFRPYFQQLRTQPGLGLALFNASRMALPAFLARCRAFGVEADHITLSRRDLVQKPLAPDERLLVVYQDLPRSKFDGPAAALVEQWLYPAWLAGRPFAFLSALDRTAYAPEPVSPTAVHEDQATVWRFLLLEQLQTLLDWAAVQYDGPDAAPRWPDAPPASRPAAAVYPLDPDLDPEQRQATGFVRGPVRVLAPAGSGKTKTLTNRILHLLNEGVPGEAILALAFNKKAQEEMTDRLAQRGVRNVTVRTFHALGYRIIRETLGWQFAGQNEHKVLRRLLEMAVRQQFELPARRDGDLLAPFADALRRTKTELPSLAEVTVLVEETAVPFAPIFDLYLRLQNRHRFLTFNDMVYLAVRLLLRDDALRRRYQRRFHYLLIDEFQDLNQAQLFLMHILALPENNLFVVGDDDQMIYGWRGAQVGHILDFPRRFPTAQQTVLATNYRSGRAIVDHSCRLIGYNQVRVEKPIRSRFGAPPGSFTLALAEDLREQARRAAGWLAARRQEGAAWRECAILYRYRAFQFPLAFALDEREIPHTAVDLPLLFQTAVGRDLHAYLALIVDPAGAPASAWARALKRPNRYLTNELISTIRGPADLERAVARPDLPDWMAERLATFGAELGRLQALAGQPETTPALLLSRLEAAMGLLDYYRGLSQLVEEADKETDDLLFETIFAVAAYYERVSDLYAAVAEMVAAPPATARPPATGADEVAFSTIHQAKGKEWPNVVYFNLSSWAHSIDVDQIEEERRVAYVAVTRARDNLLVTAQRERPSLFLRELLPADQQAWLDRETAPRP